MPHGVAPTPAPAGAPARTQRKLPITDHSIEVGKYLVSAMTRRLPDRRFSAAVSIRSGAGSATHDRVLRLTRSFANPHAARRHAFAEGRAWIDSAGAPTPSPSPEAR